MSTKSGPVGGTDSGAEASASDGGGDVTSGGDASDAGPTPTLSSVASFDATKFELAEGLTFHKGKAYVGFAPLGQINAVDPNGTVTTYGSVPPGGNNGYTLGLAFDSSDNLYVLQTQNVADAGAPTPGIYKIPAGGGNVTTPFATDPSLVFPNGIDFDAAGNLYVTDSAVGAILKVTTAGVVTTWKSDVELNGSPACPAPLPFPIGANGIIVTPTEVFVTNTAKGSIVRVAVNGDGSAGAVSTIVKDCNNVGFDGFARDKDGSFLVAQNGSPGRFVRVSGTGAVTVIAQAAPLDGPASVAIADSFGGQRAALITNSAFFSVGADGGAPKPGLLKYAPLP